MPNINDLMREDRALEYPRLLAENKTLKHELMMSQFQTVLAKATQRIFQERAEGYQKEFKEYLSRLGTDDESNEPPTVDFKSMGIQELRQAFANAGINRDVQTIRRWLREWNKAGDKIGVEYETGQSIRLEPDERDEFYRWVEEVKRPAQR